LEVASFFEESIEGTIDAIELHLHSLKVNDSVSSQVEQSGHCQTPFRLYSSWEALVKAPGFSNAYALASPVWDYHYPDPTFRRALSSNNSGLLGLHVHSNKAVAQGAIAFFLDAIVTSRVSRFEYGIEVCARYEPYNVQHAVRSSQAVFMADGVKRLPNAFSTILDEVCSQTRPFVSSF
jgi:hypothetical protein